MLFGLGVLLMAGNLAAVTPVPTCGVLPDVPANGWGNAQYGDNYIVMLEDGRKNVYTYNALSGNFSSGRISTSVASFGRGIAANAKSPKDFVVISDGNGVLQNLNSDGAMGTLADLGSVNAMASAFDAQGTLWVLTSGG